MRKGKKFPKARHQTARSHPNQDAEHGRDGVARAPDRARRPANSPPARSGGVRQQGTAKGLWLFGSHAVAAALANPRRQIHRFLATANAREALPPLSSGHALPTPEIVARPALDALFPPDTVHQGLALLAEPLAAPSLDEVLDSFGTKERALIVVLDQASDPRNIGAVLRSAAAFGASALVLPDHNAPAETGAMAKAASGALETVPVVRETNIARSLERLKAAGFWCTGLAPEAPSELAPPTPPGRAAIVLGAEGRGLRRLTLERCDEARHIPLLGAMASLNLSAAAAITLHMFRACAVTASEP